MKTIMDKFEDIPEEDAADYLARLKEKHPAEYCIMLFQEALVMIFEQQFKIEPDILSSFARIAHRSVCLLIEDCNRRQKIIDKMDVENDRLTTTLSTMLLDNPSRGNA